MSVPGASTEVQKKLRPSDSGRNAEERTARLTVADALGHVLRRQHLSPVSRDSLPRVVSDMVALHATVPTTPYLSLLARIPGFRREQLERSLYRARALVRIKCMRRTVFIVPKADLPALFAATHRTNEAEFRRYVAATGVDLAACERIAPRILKALRGREMTVAEIKSELGDAQPVSAAVALLCDMGKVVRTRAARGWRDAANAYTLLSEWLPHVALDSLGEEDGVRQMVRSYVRAYGPVTEDDISWWAGLSVSAVRGILASLARELINVEITGLPGRFLMRASEFRTATGAAVKTGSVLALVPVLDPYVMGYKDRTRLLAPELNDRVFDRGGNATSAVILDGRIVGVWDAIERPAPTIRFHLFAAGDETLRARIRGHALATGEFLFDCAVDVCEVPRMTSLAERTVGAYLSPLK